MEQAELHAANTVVSSAVNSGSGAAYGSRSPQTAASSGSTSSNRYTRLGGSSSSRASGFRSVGTGDKKTNRGTQSVADFLSSHSTNAEL
jgi:hypothetical protein